MGTMTHPDPRGEYEQRLCARRESAATLDRQARALAPARLAAFLALLAAGWLSFIEHAFTPFWTAAPALTFAALVAWHHRLLESLRAARRAVDFYERGLARLDDRWMDDGETGRRFLDPHHPFAGDLDLFGQGSLFQLLNRARTRSGEATLADWLQNPAEGPEVRARQAAVLDLRPRLDLREDIAVLGDRLEAGVAPDELIRWGKSAGAAPGRERVAAVALPAAAVLCALAGAWWFALAIYLAQSAFAFALRKRVKQTVKDAETALKDLDLLGEMLARVEAHTFEAPRLAELQHGLGAKDESPAALVHSLRVRAEMLDARMNPMFAPIAALLLWTTQVALGIEAWRSAHGHKIDRWLDTLGQFEALASLGAHAYERPDDPFAEIRPRDEGPLFDAEQMGHPLLPADRCVRNDLRLDANVRLKIVSGSNMSGKSTFLRATGVNTVLALLGAPVRAKSLRITALQPGASILATDSLREGTSRFYTEITRIRDIVGFTRAGRPLLFLLDEMLQGTNSHDRRAGAIAILENLVDAGAIGLVTTHDLALTEIAARLGPEGRNAVENVHFQDELVDGEMAFDYRLRAGVVKKSNALALMRAVGLIQDETEVHSEPEGSQSGPEAGSERVPGSGG